MKTIVIIPAFNEAAKIAEVVAAVKARAGEALAVLVVDDGSSDQTFRLAQNAGAIALRHKLNRGQGAALKTGIAFALSRGFEAAVFFDADGQMSPEEIAILTDKLAEGNDVVLGSRFLGQAIGIPPLKKLVLHLALLFTRVTTGLKLTDVHNGFQAWRSEALKKIRLNQDRQAYASQVLSEISRLKLKYAEAPVTIEYTAYSKHKGQSIFNALSILWDLLIK